MTSLSATLPAGLLLVDYTLAPLASNEEAIQILTYPNRSDGKHLNGFLTEKVRSILAEFDAPGTVSVFVTTFKSGNRLYFCRAFRLNAGSNGNSRKSVALLLERRLSATVPLSQVAAQFDLTQREQETVGYLMMGLTSKEIAGRMGISPNTVKNFIRLVMLRMGVTTRSGIIGKLLEPASSMLSAIADRPSNGATAKSQEPNGPRNGTLHNRSS